MKDANVRQQARIDIFEIWDYIVTESGNEDTADSFIRKIWQKIEILATQPNMGRKRDDLRKGLRSFGVGRYLIFYFLLADGVDVVRVIFGGRDLDALSWDENDSDN